MKILGMETSAFSFSWSDAIGRKDYAAIADWFSSRFFFVGLVGLMMAAVACGYEKSFHDGMRVGALSLIFGAACMVSGWLLGLLFGVPRSLAPATGVPTNGQTSKVNTNLEDISDWLTKTIVGVGLTQLLSLPHYLWFAANKLNTLGFGWDPYGQILVLTLFLYFTPGGFWLGYVGTRTMLTRLLDQFAVFTPQDVDTSKKPENLKLDISGQKIQPASDGLASADQALLSVPLQSLSTPQELAAWAGAQARKGDLAAAQVALEQATRSAPEDDAIRRQLAIVYTALGRRDDADRLLGPGNTYAAMFNALYDPPPGGYGKAIQIGKELAKRPGADKEDRLHFWLACAYGQQYQYEKTHGASEPALQAIKDKVLDEAKTAIAANPAAKALLYGVWQPTRDGEFEEDNDLAGFDKDDPQLKALLAS